MKAVFVYFTVHAITYLIYRVGLLQSQRAILWSCLEDTYCICCFM